MSDHTPNTDEVREAYMRARTRSYDAYQTGVYLAAREGQLRAAFDRWLNQALADAWDEGFNAGHETARFVQPGHPALPPNPHRKEERCS